ncbi:polymorphic toxin type 50 domain-containing protein [Staphylococcus xylosus]
MYQEKARKELLDLVENGKIKLTINKQSQEKHRPGTNQYKNKVEKMKSTGYQPSIIDVSDTELEDVILSNHGKGDVLVTGKGSFKKTEVLDFGKVIGKSYVNGEYVETKFGKVHYSKTGTHVVPFIYG